MQLQVLSRGYSKAADSHEFKNCFLITIDVCSVKRALHESSESTLHSKTLVIAVAHLFVCSCLIEGRGSIKRER